MMASEHPQSAGTIPDIRTVFCVRPTQGEYHWISEALAEAMRDKNLWPADWRYGNEAALAGICREWLETKKKENANG